jgi:hypothetical protein
MWDVAGEQFLREQREVAELREATEWGDYIPVGGELTPPDLDASDLEQNDLSPSHPAGPEDLGDSAGVAYSRTKR